MIEHLGPISGVAAHPNGYVVTAGYDNQLILWDHARRVAVSRAIHDHLANQCAFNADGSVLVSASSDYTARLWSVPDLRLLAVLSHHEDDVEMAVFDPSGTRVATASRDHRARIFTTEGELVAELTGHRADVISVAWSAAGDQVVTSSDDGTVKRWDAGTGALLADIDVGGVETDTLAVDSRGTIYAGNDDGEILVLDGTTDRRHQAHQSGVKRIVLDPEETRVLTLSYDRTLALWDISGGPTDVRLILRADILPDVWPRSAAFLGSDLVFGTFGSAYRIFDTLTASWAHDEVPSTPGVNAVAALPGGHVLTVGDAGVLAVDGEITAETGSLCNFLVRAFDDHFTGGQLGTVFRASTGEPVHQHRSPLNCGTYVDRAGPARLVVGTYTGEALVFVDAEHGPVLERTVAVHDNAIKGLASDGRYVFSVCADTSVAWLDATTLEVVHRKPAAHDRIVNGCASLGSGRFASVGRDRVLNLWAPDFEAQRVEAPNRNSIKCVAASEDGRYVVCGDYGGGIAVYTIDAARWAVPARATTSGISSLTYDAGLDRFLASSYDGRVYTVELVDGAWRVDQATEGPRAGLPAIAPAS